MLWLAVAVCVLVDHQAAGTASQQDGAEAAVGKWEQYVAWLLESPHLPFKWIMNLDHKLDRDHSKDQTGRVHPVVLFGGLFAVELEAELNKPAVTHEYCSKTGKANLWLDIADFLPDKINCWMNNMMMEWNPGKKEFEDRGVAVQPKHFGGIDGFTFDMFDFVYAALQPLGYGKTTIRGAHHDWRLGPAEWKLNGQYDRTKELVEDMVKEHRAPVTLMSISQGAQVVHNFLAEQSAEWKEAHIESWVSLSGVFGGTPDALGLTVFPSEGDIEGVGKLPWASAEQFRDHTMAWPVSYALAPMAAKSAGATGDEVILTVTTGGVKKSYTAHTVSQVWEDIGRPWQTSLYEARAAPYQFHKLPDPGVKVHCWYGKGLPTPAVLNYNDGPGQPHTDTMGDGDGSVWHAGLKACWAWKQVEVQEFQGYAHKDLVWKEDAVRMIAEMLGAKNDLLRARDQEAAKVSADGVVRRAAASTATGEDSITMGTSPGEV